jgi:hypothetical protein
VLAKVFMRDAESQALLISLDRISSESSATWFRTYSPSKQRLFKLENNGWVFFHVVSGQRHSVNRQYHHGGVVSTIPSDVVPATVVAVQGLGIRLITRGLPPRLAETAPILSFSQTLDALPALSAWAIQEYALPSNLRPILQNLSSGTARAVSDGSFKDKFGTSAFTVVDDDETSILGLNVVPGHPDDQSAYRSKLAGLFGIVMLDNLLSKWAGILSGTIEVGCDGLSALNKAFDMWPLNPDDPHFDMLNSLRAMIAESPITWTTRHVDGHQDDDINATLDCAPASTPRHPNRDKQNAAPEWNAAHSTPSLSES